MFPISVDSPPYTEIALVSGVYVYEARAAVGSATTDPVWQAWRWDTTGPIVRLWADGDTKFDNQADNLAGLSYS